MVNRLFDASYGTLIGSVLGTLFALATKTVAVVVTAVVILRWMNVIP